MQWWKFRLQRCFHLHLLGIMTTHMLYFPNFLLLVLIIPKLPKLHFVGKCLHRLFPVGNYWILALQLAIYCWAIYLACQGKWASFYTEPSPWNETNMFLSIPFDPSIQVLLTLMVACGISLKSSQILTHGRTCMISLVFPSWLSVAPASSGGWTKSKVGGT